MYKLYITNEPELFFVYVKSQRKGMELKFFTVFWQLMTFLNPNYLIDGLCIYLIIAAIKFLISKHWNQFGLKSGRREKIFASSSCLSRCNLLRMTVNTSE